MKLKSPRSVHLLTLATLIPTALGFSFNTSTPTQCGDMTVQWDGGTEPFYLILIPTESLTAGRIMNVSIPPGLQPPYSHTFRLDEPAGLHFLATMYDSKGFGTGGTTSTLRVGSSSNTSCLSTDLRYDFFFYIDPQNNPSQCQSMRISWDNTITYPLNLYGLIPSGTPFDIPISQQTGNVSVDWQVDIDDGTQFLLFMADAGEYQTGGSTSLFTVQSGNDNCMTSSSPKIAGNASGGSNDTGSSGGSVEGVGGSSSGGDGQGSTNGSGGGGGAGAHTGAIVGGTLGGVAFLALLGILLWFCIRQRTRDKSNDNVRSYGFNKEKGPRESRGHLDLLGPQGPERHHSDDSSNTAALGDGRSYTPMPFRYPSPEARDSNGSPLASAGFGAHDMPATSAVLAGTPMNEKRRSGTTVTPDVHNDIVLPHQLYEGSDRPSSDARYSHDTGPNHSGSGTGTGTGLTPSTDHRARPHIPPGAMAPVGPSAYHDRQETSEGQSDSATIGRLQRNSSVHKPSIGGDHPAGDHPAQGVLADNDTPDSPGAARPLPEVPMQYVQHQDSGRIVDLPPRYDQLRAANPDP
ncbi:hypothetical protein BD324DRAFT_618333 [Kockovaella imperatae]|uniref:Uncharacterized protein n=1 Tax=Kockovaella imperatae TaxID=4999 RepID=A0A1Y1UM26_9TREE|nr:hypothetical protein BD324DRAFT_618333 [Kockovaella imperatae]ORX39049.1 hypothetical protein BD324DRAFT_618333 [Kockovaella imperatae]